MRPVLFLAAAAMLTSCVADTPHRKPSAARAISVPVQQQPVPHTSLLAQLVAAAPRADPTVLKLAMRARDCAIERGVATSDAALAVIDYSRPSTQPRLWVFDLAGPRLLFDEYVAHGKGSGDNFARRFSNEDGSLESSLGLFATAETYVGDNGYSLRLDGLEAGINDHARSRLLVMHGAWYVDPLLALKQGRIGRSYGCPALRPQVAHAVIDTLKQGQLLFAYYPDAAWLAGSRFIHCDQSLSADERDSRFHTVSR